MITTRVYQDDRGRWTWDKVDDTGRGRTIVSLQLAAWRNPHALNRWVNNHFAQRAAAKPDDIEWPLVVLCPQSDPQP